MEIKEIYIKSFLSTKEKTYKNFKSGINVIFGLNESGKTTLMEFLKNAFFKKNPTIRKNFEGSIDFIEKSDTYISRFKNNDIEFIKNEYENSDFKIDEFYFKRFFTINLDDLMTKPKDEKEFLEAIINFDTSILKPYENRIKKELENNFTTTNLKTKSKLYEIREKIKNIESEIKDLLNQEDKYNENKLNIKNIKNEIENTKEELNKIKDKHFLYIFPFIFLIFEIITFKFSYVLSCLFLILTIIFVFYLINIKNKNNKKTEKIINLKDEKIRYLGSLEEKNKMFECRSDISDLIRKKESYKNKYNEIIKNLISKELVLSFLNSVKKDLNKEQINLTNANKYFEILTDKYNKIIIQNSTIKVQNRNLEIKNFDELSKGTKEQLYFALRLGLISNYKELNLPLILDDIFVNFDNKRVKNAIYCLNEFSKNNQIIFFTCHDNIIKIMEEEQISFNKIELVS